MKHLGEKTRSSGRSDGEQKRDMQKEAPEKYQDKIFELEEQRAENALALVRKKHMLMKCEGEREMGKDHAKVGGVESNRSMVRRPRLIFFWFLLTVPGPPYRRSNVCFLQDGARGG